MSESVLVVDDSLTVRMNLAEILETAGFSVVTCATGGEARQQLRVGTFALVILDVMLPDADGVELLKEIRERPETTDVGIVLLSSEAEVRDRVRGFATGADEYIGKPYDPGYLVARARELVRRRPTGALPASDTVLVIDDSITFAEALREALEEASFKVVVAGSGEEGLRLAAHIRPIAILVDRVLPGIDGGAVVRRLRFDTALRRVPCLLLTSSEDRDAEVWALEAGADAFVRKEEDVDVILARFKAMLRSAGNQIQDDSSAGLLATKKILIVDDNETYLQELADILRTDGYDIVLARSGEEALALLDVQTVDCILLDVAMSGMSGEETCRRLKSRSDIRDIPVVMMTALEDRESMIRGLESGADDFIAKSGEFVVLRARMSALLRRRQFEDENRLHRHQAQRQELEAAEARAAAELAEVRARLVEELEAKNRELDAFSYSVAHDLRAPLRSIDGFSQAILEECADQLDEHGKQYLGYVRDATKQMSSLIESLLGLARIMQGGLQREPLDLTLIVRSVAERLSRLNASESVEIAIEEGLVGEGDAHLLTVVFDNLLSNAWKFTRKRTDARVEVGVMHQREERCFYVRDNGAGFDMEYAPKLFGVFQRLHAAADFEGTGIGLATVRRIVERHGGRIWAEAEVGRGATFFFTLADRE